jgi:Ankyrin repeats (3 copies)
MSAAHAKALDATDELSRDVESGDVEALALLLPRVGNINARNRHGMTALMHAARCGHAQIVRLLLEHGADPNLTRNDKFTALALAAFFGHTETVKTLMEFGARTEAVTRCGASAQTWATARTFAEVARCLDTPVPKTSRPHPRIQVQNNSPKRRFLALGVIATIVVIVCCAFGAMVLNKSEARDLQPAAVPPPKVETRVITPEPVPPTPEPVVAEAPRVEPRTANIVRPAIKKAPAPSPAVKSLPVLSEQPKEEVKVSAPPVVAKPKFEPPKPVALSPQIMESTKKAKVIQWP